MAMKQAKVSDHELQDFWSGCRDRGHNAGEFMVSAQEDTPLNPGPIARIVVVQRTFRGNVLAQQFEASSGHDWVVPALDALSAGAFGSA